MTTKVYIIQVRWLNINFPYCRDPGEIHSARLVETEGKRERSKNNKTVKLERRRTIMNEDILKGKWKEIKGEVKQKWGKLTDDDLAQVEGKEEELLGLLQKRYGYAKEKAAEEYKGFIVRYQKPPSGEKVK
jgi:uncharacterized protein YjbJ (UPF0337 family)